VLPFKTIMKIGVGQIACKAADVAANVATLTAAVHEAARQGCEAVVLPEVADTGYALSKMRVVAGTWDGGAFASMQAAARAAGITVICGLAERDGDDLYNSLAVIDSQGKLQAKYRKIHLLKTPQLDESKRFKSGDALALADIGGLRWGFMICYDLRFPELSRALMKRGADVLVYSSAWPLGRIGHWRAMLPARAVENQAFVIACNRVGSEEDVVLGGASFVIAPDGTTLAGAGKSEEIMITAELDLDLLEATRKEVLLRETMRPDLYAKLNRELGTANSEPRTRTPKP
jgi:predicted amidohydrolase